MRVRGRAGAAPPLLCCLVFGELCGREFAAEEPSAVRGLLQTTQEFENVSLITLGKPSKTVSHLGRFAAVPKNSIPQRERSPVVHQSVA